ncbi:hypothetical protein VTK73DRAFT_7877 [Phialemonium thermophilum]|uniref:Alpha-D-xyloside xylohydrolase n=1 Tax=Phialemonium thermophilum TaxID=223376 RepID=A0ABR3XRA7_9PEZI
MKLRDGMWNTAPGLHVEYAEEVYNIEVIERGLRLLCPTRKILTRGDTLNRPTITISIEAVMDGVLSVEMVHWEGARAKGPNFELFPGGRPEVQPVVTRHERGTTIASGSLAATVSSEPHTFNIQFHEVAISSCNSSSSSSNSRNAANSRGIVGRTLTSLGTRSVGFAYRPAPTSPLETEDLRGLDHHLFVQTDLSVGESVHGLGERFGAFNKVGQTVQLWNADGGTSSEQAYKNVSFWLSSRGYGVFIDTPERVELEVGSERCSRVETSVAGQRLRWFVLNGPTPRQVLRRYAVLTGLPSALPAWSFGLWLTTSFTTDYDEATVQGFLGGMRERGIAVDVFHFDCFWMRAFAWTDFVFDAARFPDPAGQITRLKAAGLCRKVSVWINPYIAQHGAAFAHAAREGYLLRRTNGDVWQWDMWQAGMALVDFTNPAACTWYADCLNRLFDLGVDCLKTDFGERIPWRDVRWHDPSVDPARMHNYYAFLYNRVVYEALEARFGPGQGVLFARAACAGTQRFPLQWGGDCESTPAAMAESLRGGLSLGLSGFGYWSVDIGGFEGSPPPWIYKRWVAFGLLCSHSRLHGSNSYRVPWLIDGDDRSEQGCTATLARWSALKNRLMPYLLAQARRTTTTGLPLSLRATCIEFPDDPTSWYLDRQFFVGDSLLVAPVFDESGEVEFYLPKGRWTSFFTNQVRTGPGWFRERHSFASLPLYVRENTILVLGSVVARARNAIYDYSADAEIVLYDVQPGCRAEVVDSSGSEAGVLEIGQDGTLTGTEALTGAWQVRRDSRELDDSVAEHGIESLD